MTHQYPPPPDVPPAKVPRRIEKGKLPWYIGGGLVAATLWLGSCAAVIGALNDEPTAAPPPPPASSAPASSEPPTRLPPTPTPDPPTVDPDAADKAAFAVWGAQMSEEANKMQDILSDIQVAAEAEDIDALQTHADELIDQADAMKKIQPPKEGKYATLHTEYNAMLKDFRRAGVLMGRGVESLDVSLINEASEELESGSAHTERVTEEIEELS